MTTLIVFLTIYLTIYAAGGHYILGRVKSEPYISGMEASSFLFMAAILWAIASGMISGLAIALLMMVEVL